MDHDLTGLMHVVKVGHKVTVHPNLLVMRITIFVLYCNGGLLTILSLLGRAKGFADCQT